MKQNIKVRFSQIKSAYSFEGMKLEERRRRLFLLVSAVVSLAAMVVFAPLDLLNGSFVEAGFEVAAGIWMVLILVRIRGTEQVQWAFDSIVLIMGSLFVFLTASGGVDGTKIYYTFLFPVFGFYLLGTWRGLLLNGIFFAVLIFFYANPFGLSGVHAYTVEGAVRLCVVFLLIALANFSYELVRSSTAGALEMERNKLNQANKKLQVAIKEAHQASRSKSTFLANMSHEIRTPMNGVLGMTHLLKDTTLDERQQEFARIIKNSADALLDIINDILDYSKIESGKIELEQIDFNLRMVVEAVGDLFAVKVNEKKLELIIHIEPDVPCHLLGDPGRIRQILINLVGNAVKFTPKGEIVLRVEKAGQAGSHVLLCFNVTDTGVGIPEGLLETVFETFSQADTSTSRMFGGTGLGLNISKKLSEIMGGEIGVKSSLGQGSRFWFTAKLSPQPGRPVQDLVIPDGLGKKQILIVDGNPTRQTVLRGQLEGWGCRCRLAPDRPAALEILKKALDRGDPFDIALVDMGMAKMDGRALGHAFKEGCGTGPSQVVLMIPMGDARALADAEQGGFTCLTKPVKVAFLLEALSQACGLSLARVLGPKDQDRKSPGQTAPSGHRPRILLAEDNPVNQKVAMNFIRKFGYEADVAENGVQALQFMKKSRYALVLMDCQMPGMDGYETTAVVRERTVQVLDPGIPIIAMTANAMKGDREKCILAGMNDYLSKPINPKVLETMLEKWAFAPLIK